MELVTLGHAVLNRVGTASSGGFVSDRRFEEIREIPDSSVEALRELVLSIAEKHGEQRVSLEKMSLVQGGAYGYGSETVFDIHGPNTRYSNPYAQCVSFSALKVGDRYFKLEEVNTGVVR